MLKLINKIIIPKSMKTLDRCSILSCDQKLNLLNAERNRLHNAWGPKAYYYVMYDWARDREIIVASCGSLGREFAVGTKHCARHDQSMREIGTLEVIEVLKANMLHTSKYAATPLRLYCFK